VGSVTILALAVACMALAGACLLYIVNDPGPTRVAVLPSVEGQVLELNLLIDLHGLFFSLMAMFVCVIVAAFGQRYMHREPGYFRYFTQFNLFTLGILLIGLAGSTTMLFAGWEFLGVSSALLVGFFHERSAPVTNALRVFTVYRIGDAAMLSAAALAQLELGSGKLESLFAADGNVLTAVPATVIALLLLVAAAAKCGQLPFSGWLPRAMEGPTPSSAVFYGALSIHAGAFVLLRAGPLLEAAPLARVMLAVMGASTAVFATIVGRVQTDIKSSLAFASLTQVSIILVEISLGWYDLALIHMIGHALFRLLQFLRSPSILHEFHEASEAMGGHPNADSASADRLIPLRWQPALYRLALERGSLDGLLDRFVVNPFLTIADWLDSLERRWSALCAGRRSLDGRSARKLRDLQ
jgi:NAD(P)H-quinone oxidoreductase subunit 5